MTRELVVPLVCDFVVVVCKGCAVERTEHFDPPIEGAAQVHEWLTTKLVKRCGCGASHADVKFHIVPEPEERN